MLSAGVKEKLKNRLYPAADQSAHGPIQRALRKHIRPGARVLDAGCGPGTWVLRDYRANIGLLAGCDAGMPQERRLGFDVFSLGDLHHLPYQDGVFDVVLLYFVIEHLQYPVQAFKEIRRVLKEDGVLVFKTPQLSAPLFLLSRLVPVIWHRRAKKWFQGTAESDVFVTYYKCNTQGGLNRALASSGFRKVSLEAVEQIYDYLLSHKMTYAAGLIASRVMQALPGAECLRSQLIGVYRSETRPSPIPLLEWEGEPA